jgi:hypothetical protein
MNLNFNFKAGQDLPIHSHGIEGQDAYAGPGHHRPNDLR